VQLSATGSSEVTAGFEPAIGVLQTPALPLGHVTTYGAEDEIRTRDLLLGKEMLYQLSHFR
jgi:hypothetical protein